MTKVESQKNSFGFLPKTYKNNKHFKKNLVYIKKKKNTSYAYQKKTCETLVLFHAYCLGLGLPTVHWNRHDTNKRLIFVMCSNCLVPMCWSQAFPYCLMVKTDNSKINRPSPKGIIQRQDLLPAQIVGYWHSMKRSTFI